MNKQMLRFRESFRGYNRDDVNAYIEQISFMFSRKESELRAQIAELEAKLTCASSSENNEQELNDLKMKLNCAAENIDSLKKELETAKAEKISGEEDEKSKLYDSMSAQVGNIIIVANANAEKILNDAKAEAEKIRVQADEYALNKRSEADAKIKEIEERSNIRIKELTTGCINDFSDVVMESVTKLNNLTEALRSKSECILSDFNCKIKEAEEKYNI